MRVLLVLAILPTLSFAKLCFAYLKRPSPRLLDVYSNFSRDTFNSSEKIRLADIISRRFNSGSSESNLTEKSLFVRKLLIDEKLKKYDGSVNRTFRQLDKNMLVLDSAIAGGLFVPASNTLRINVPTDLRGTLVEHLLTIHEMEHVFQTEEQRLGILTPDPRYTTEEYRVARFHKEVGAVRAEWEFLQYFTPREIAHAISEVKKSVYIDEQSRKRLIDSLSAAHLTFREYLQKSPYPNLDITNLEYDEMFSQ